MIGILQRIFILHKFEHFFRVFCLWHFELSTGILGIIENLAISLGPKNKLVKITMVQTVRISIRPFFNTPMVTLSNAVGLVQVQSVTANFAS